METSANEWRTECDTEGMFVPILPGYATSRLSLRDETVLAAAINPVAKLHVKTVGKA
jgi:hypothetical protein